MFLHTRTMRGSWQRSCSSNYNISHFYAAFHLARTQSAALNPGLLPFLNVGCAQVSQIPHVLASHTSKNVTTNSIVD